MVAWYNQLPLQGKRAQTAKGWKSICNKGSFGVEKCFILRPADMPALPQTPQLQVLSQGQFLEAQQSHSQGREDSGNSSCLWTFSWKPEDLSSFSWASLTLYNARCPHPSLFQPWHQVTYYYNLAGGQKLCGGAKWSKKRARISIFGSKMSVCWWNFSLAEMGGTPVPSPS